jgi:predicted phosphodiesterase
MQTIPPSTRIAILTDIHGNSLALDAVLRDIESSGGVDKFWLLGDYAAIGSDPTGVLERLASLEQAVFIRGNTDRYLYDRSQPWPRQENPDADVQVARSFAWTTGAIGTKGWLPWLEGLPLDFRAILPDGTKILAVHAAPGEDDGDGIHSRTQDRELEQIAQNAGCNLLLVGHTHSPFDRSISGLRIVNPGSVSNPFLPDLRAAYVLLQVSEDGCELAFHRVDYDREAVIAHAKAVNHPAWEYIASFMYGKEQPWLNS